MQNQRRRDQERFREDEPPYSYEHQMRPHRPPPREQQGYFRGQTGYENEPYGYNYDHPSPPPEDYQQQRSERLRHTGDFGYKGDPGYRQSYYHDEGPRPGQYPPASARSDDYYEDHSRREHPQPPHSEYDHYPPSSSEIDSYPRDERSYREDRTYSDDPSYRGEREGYQGSIQQGYGPGGWEKGGYQGPPQYGYYQAGPTGGYQGGPQPGYDYPEYEYPPSYSPSYEQHPSPERPPRQEHERPHHRYPSEPAHDQMRPRRSRPMLGGHWESEMLERGGAYREDEGPIMRRPLPPRRPSYQPRIRSERAQAASRQDDRQQYQEWLRHHEGEPYHHDAERQFEGLDDGNQGGHTHPQEYPQPRSQRMKEEEQVRTPKAKSRSTRRSPQNQNFSSPAAASAVSDKTRSSAPKKAQTRKR